MKQKRKHILKKSIFLGLILLQFSCNLEEEFITEKNHLGNNRIRYLYGEEALKKGKNLEAKMMTSNKINVLSRTNISLSTNEGVVDYTKVLEVIDENNIVNYTFAIKNHPDDSERVFHNLILSNENSNDEEILLLRYESDTPNTSIINFIGTITTKSISSATNPCDTSTSDADFTGMTGSDNGSSTYIPGGNNVIVEPPPIGTSGWGGGGAGNNNVTISDTPATYTCNTPNCGFSTTSRWEILDHETPQGFTTSYSHRIANNETINPCDPNGNIGIINDSVVKTPCEVLTRATNTSNYKIKFNLLNQPSKFTAPQESGFALVKNTAGIYYNIDLLAIGSSSLKPPHEGINFTHVHNNKMKLDSISGETFDHAVKILSPEDIKTLTDDMLNTNTSADIFAPSDTFAVMISNEGIFAITPTVNYITILKKDYENFNNKYHKQAADIIIFKRNTYNTAEKRKKALEKMMLKLINETPGFKGKLELFECDATDPNHIKWTKKSLNSSNQNIVDQTPC